jgi:uncharacterized transporter YbjL
MMRIALLCALSGCVTAAGIAKREQVSFPLLLGATGGDLVVTGVVAGVTEDLTVLGSIGTALAITAVDVAVGCLFGACSSLKL